MDGTYEVVATGGGAAGLSGARALSRAVIGGAAAGLDTGAPIDADLVAEDTRPAVAVQRGEREPSVPHADRAHAAGVFDEQAWEERYRSHAAVWSGRANPQLVAEATDLAPGAALDVGSGEGSDALWLAARGWRVTAVDFATTALRRGAEQADALGADVAGRIRWVHADLTTWAPTEGHFDLVSAQFMHLPAAARQALFARLSTMVAPGGTLLVVGHHPGDLQTTMPRPPIPGMYYTAEEAAESLDPDQWDILVADARPRPASDPEGQEVTIHDAVLRARRRR